ncbi:MAG TPA: NUDIX domain-containing protein [Acidimicrobiales bacterium]
MSADEQAAGEPLASLLGFSTRDPREAEDLLSIIDVARSARPFDRSSRFHLTASALVLDPSAGRVLLRWHTRHESWMQVGGHGDPGESDPYAVAHREAVEETGLTDLVAFPDAAAPRLFQVAVVAVPGNKAEPAHLHGDVRYVMATSSPGAIVAEGYDTPLRWCSFAEASTLVGEDNLRALLERTEKLLSDGFGASDQEP